MKKMIMTILLVTASEVWAMSDAVSSSQEPMFPSDTEWHYRETNMFEEISTSRTYGVQDTLLNGVAYQYTHGVFLRTEGAKVWCVVDSADQQIEQLLYDFDLQVGDSIRTISFARFEMGEAPHFARVTNIKTIMLPDGRSARHISYNNRADDIEHIGCVNGLLHAAFMVIPPNGIIEDFICCTRGGNLLYEISQGECGMLAQDIDKIHFDSPSATKILRNGQLLILRGVRTYTPTGQEMK